MTQETGRTNLETVIEAAIKLRVEQEEALLSTSDPVERKRLERGIVLVEQQINRLKSDPNALYWQRPLAQPSKEQIFEAAKQEFRQALKANDLQAIRQWLVRYPKVLEYLADGTPNQSASADLFFQNEHIDFLVGRNFADIRLTFVVLAELTPAKVPDRAVKRLSEILSYCDNQPALVTDELARIFACVNAQLAIRIKQWVVTQSGFDFYGIIFQGKRFEMSKAIDTQRNQLNESFPKRNLHIFSYDHISEAVEERDYLIV